MVSASLSYVKNVHACSSRSISCFSVTRPFSFPPCASDIIRLSIFVDLSGLTSAILETDDDSNKDQGAGNDIQIDARRSRAAESRTVAIMSLRICSSCARLASSSVPFCARDPAGI